LLPGAVGNEASTQQESFTLNRSEKDGKPKIKAGEGADPTCGSNGLLDYPHYTRPAEFRGMPVPKALMSGNHEEIRCWRRHRALEKTFRNRPDLLEGAALTEEEAKFLNGLRLQNGGIS
jgi:tRNA (guanine37-N1)-methyltransferase